MHSVCWGHRCAVVSLVIGCGVAVRLLLRVCYRCAVVIVRLSSLCGCHTCHRCECEVVTLVITGAVVITGAGVTGAVVIADVVVTGAVVFAGAFVTGAVVITGAGVTGVVVITGAVVTGAVYQQEV